MSFASTGEGAETAENDREGILFPYGVVIVVVSYDKNIRRLRESIVMRMVRFRNFRGAYTPIATGPIRERDGIGVTPITDAAPDISISIPIIPSNMMEFCVCTCINAEYAKSNNK